MPIANEDDNRMHAKKQKVSTNHSYQSFTSRSNPWRKHSQSQIVFGNNFRKSSNSRYLTANQVTSSSTSAKWPVHGSVTLPRYRIYIWKGANNLTAAMFLMLMSQARRVKFLAGAVAHAIRLNCNWSRSQAHNPRMATSPIVVQACTTRRPTPIVS